MNLRVFPVLCGIVMLALAGCDTPGVRARCHPGTFGKLSASDRQLVLAGKVRAGMSGDAVYVAWGDPDAKRRSGDCKDASETWLYRRQLTIKPPMDSFDRWLPGNSIIGRTTVPLTVNGGFGFGGVGNEGITLYQPHLQITDDAVRQAEFKSGKLTRYEEFQAGSAAAR